MDYLLLYTVAFIVLLLVPIIIEMLINYWTFKKLLEKASLDHKLSNEELNACLSMIATSTSGGSNITRRLVSVAIIAILGIAIFNTLVAGIPNSNTGDSAQITNNILSMLAGTLAAMIGFYFGGRTAEKAGEQRNLQMIRVSPIDDSHKNQPQ
jgi:hypothetical protein